MRRRLTGSLARAHRELASLTCAHPVLFGKEESTSRELEFISLQVVAAFTLQAGGLYFLPTGGTPTPGVHRTAAQLAFLHSPASCIFTY